MRLGSCGRQNFLTFFIDLSSGISIDWVHSAAQTPIAYTYEFRDTGDSGFELPPDQIIPNAEEVLDSLVVLINEASGLGYLV
jgi:Zinc carboxypeptidase